MDIPLFELTDKPVDELLYKKLSNDEKPLIITGAIINNAYDHVRINIPQAKRPVRIKVGNTFIFGLSSKPNLHFREKYKRITSVPVDDPKSHDMYRARTKLYGLSCDTCWRLLRKNVFPLDMSSLSAISINSINENHFNRISEDLPWFTQYTTPKTFIVT